MPDARPDPPTHHSAYAAPRLPRQAPPKLAVIWAMACSKVSDAHYTTY